MITDQRVLGPMWHRGFGDGICGSSLCLEPAWLGRVCSGPSSRCDWTIHGKACERAECQPWSACSGVIGEDRLHMAEFMPDEAAGVGQSGMHLCSLVVVQRILGEICSRMRPVIGRTLALGSSWWHETLAGVPCAGSLRSCVSFAGAGDQNYLKLAGCNRGRAASRNESRTCRVKSIVLCAMPMLGMTLSSISLRPRRPSLHDPKVF